MNTILWSGSGPMPSLWPGMPEAYSILARFYDLCIEADYAEWVDYLLELCRYHDHAPHTVVDLGCGTGNLTLPLAELGCQLTGVDLSPAMVAEARRKAAQRGLDIAFHAADLRTFSPVEGAFDTAISGCDVLNYCTTKEDLRAAFASVKRLLAPGGLWLFDLNSSWKLRELYGNQSYADLREDFAYFWDNAYDEAAGVCTMDLTFFVLTPDGKYERVAERHVQKLWLPEQISELCDEFGFALLSCCDFPTLDPASAEGERWQFVVKKPEEPN